MSIRIDGTNTTANPGITGGDADTGLQFGTDEVKVVTGGSDRMVVDSSGNVGIGTTSPGKNLDIEASDPRMRLSSNASNNATVELLSNAKTSYIYSQNSGNLNLQGNGSVVFLSNSGTEAARIDTSQRLLVGTSSARSDFASTTAYRVQVEGTDLAGSSLSLTRNSNSNAGPGLQFAKSRASANGGNVIVQNNDVLAYILFDGNDGADFARAAQITAEVDGTPGTNDMPGRLVFSTTADGASSPTERLRITQTGKIRAPQVYSQTTTTGGSVYVQSDGDLLRYTSSAKYKTDIETVEDARADAILNCRPVWYRSTCESDIATEGSEKSDWGWYGFIAEEVAEVEPRLVNWATKDAVEQEDGSMESIQRDPADYTAEGVRYENFVPLLVNLVKRQQAAIETLEAKVAALEGQ